MAACSVPLSLPRRTSELLPRSSVATDMKRTLVIAAAALAAILVSAAQVGAQGGRALTLTATPTTVKFGGTVTLAGKLTGSNSDGRNVTVRAGPVPRGRVRERRQRHDERGRATGRSS